MSGRDVRVVAAVSAVLLMGFVACANKKDGRSSAEPTAAEAFDTNSALGGEARAEPEDDFAADEGGETLSQLEAELVSVEADLRARGVVLSAAPATDTEVGDDGGAEAASTPADTCNRICDLKQAICGLESKICRLADEHQGKARYAGICDRAKSDCESATQACDDCSG